MKDERWTMNESRRPFIALLPSLIVLLSLAWTTAPQLLHLAREATALAPLSRAERRARVNGAIVESVRRIKRVQPPAEPVALIGSVDDTVLANYYGYPWLSRDFLTSDLYRAMAGQPRRPNTIVSVSSGLARLVTYAELRDARLRGQRLVRGASLKPAPRTFVVPLAGSVDGLPPDTYVTEAEFANDAAEPARVRVTLLPEQKVQTLTIPPHGSVAFYDLVYQLFREMEVRWVTVESDQPLRAGVWFVNRGRNEIVPLPLAERWSTGTLTCPAAECKVWLLNRLDRGNDVSVDGHAVALTARGMTSLPFQGTAHVVSHDDAFAFATTKGPPTLFIWPEGVHP